MYKIYFLLVIAFAFSCNQNKSKVGEVIQEGYFECFDENLTQENGRPYTCEPSTVVFYDNQIFVANDKDFPDGNSSLFSFGFVDEITCNSRTYYKNSLFYYIDKYESSSITPDKKFLLFSSSYSYASTDSANGEKYNTTIFVNSQNIEKGGILHISNDSAMNSIDIKEQIVSALKSDKFPKGPGYLKIEGLTVIPGNKILFGVREIGDKYSDFDYAITILSANYVVENEQIKLTGNIERVYDFIPTDTLGISLPIGLSSIEYSPFDEQIYLVTSFEHGEDTKSIGAYLWYLSIEELNSGAKPHIVMADKETPLRFIHKIEGLTILDKNKVLVIADDDRVTGEGEPESSFRRKLNQAYWAVVKLK
ncbi:MAG: hypothetical protein JXL97_17870 [Bacteroidales bacterium]|nr:hypothetical protein [Bacteroidales bacterium]